jgi:predicted SAM-dependent methyltransferase
VKEKIKRTIFPLYAFFRTCLSRLIIRKILKSKKKIFLELGAGNKEGVGDWVTIDMTRKCDIFFDLTKGIPFPDGSVEKIYSSHFFEHLSFKESQILLDECLRVLVPNGIFSICVPNARIYVEAYFKDSGLPERYLVHRPALNNATKIDFINYIAYMDGHHKYMFDEENLVQMLRAKGMKNAHLREFDSSIDLKDRVLESIYAEAQK